MSKNAAFHSASPQKNFQTRTIYKNAQEDETVNDMRSLYNATIGQNSKSQNKLAKPTLADLGAASRHSSRGSNRLEPIRRPSQGSQASQRSATKAAAAPNALTQSVQFDERPKTEALKSAAGGARPAKEPHQCKYESELLKEQMKKTFGDNPNINIDNEAEYYETVKRLDVCGKCWAAQQKFYTNPIKIKHRGPGQSLYQKDYVKHPLDAQGPTLKNDFYTTFKNTEPMDFTTTAKNDFKNWGVPPPKKETMNWMPATTGMPFSGASNYRIEYADWGANKCAYEKASQMLTTIPELPFICNTTYRDAFAQPEATQQLKPKDRDLWNKNKKPPITSAIPFLGESTNAAAYKPYKVENMPNFEVDDEYAPTEALPEHHKSLYARDFANKNQWVCPAVIFMENTPHPKLKHLAA